MHKRKVAVIRSNDGRIELRTSTVIEYFQSTDLETKVIFWLRHGNSRNTKDDSFHLRLEFDAGIRNIFGHMLFNFWILFRLLKHRPELLYCCDFDTLPGALTYLKLFRARLIYDQYDLSSSRKLPKFMLALIKALENQACSVAETVFIADESRKSFLPNSDKIVLRRNLSTRLKRKVDSNLPKFDRFTLFYGGLLLPDRGLGRAIDAVLENPEWDFLVVGDGPELERLSIAKPQVTLLGRLDHSEMVELLNRSHLTLITYDPINPNNRYTASGKFYESLVVGVPAITALGTSVNQLNTLFGNGYQIEYNNVSQLSQVLKKFRTSNFVKVPLPDKFWTESLEESLNAHILLP